MRRDLALYVPDDIRPYKGFSLELTPRQRECLAGICRYGSARKAAAAFGVHRSAVHLAARRAIFKIRLRLRFARRKALERAYSAE